MDSYDICLYGHLTIDRVFEDFQERVTLGAMANVWHAMTYLDTHYKIKLNPVSLGEAIIVVNCSNSERIGRGNLNIKTRTPNIVNSRWHHIMYLNQLPNPSFINEINNGIISADITSGNIQSIFPYLNKIDYLFISDEDLFIDIKELGKKVKGTVILHYPSGSYVTNGKTSFNAQTKILENINVLGAGDIFAACFITQQMKTNNIKESINYAHKKTAEILMKRR